MRGVERARWKILRRISAGRRVKSVNIVELTISNLLRYEKWNGRGSDGEFIRWNRLLRLLYLRGEISHQEIYS